MLHSVCINVLLKNAHRYPEQVEKQLTKKCGNIEGTFFFIFELHFFANRIIPAVMNSSVKTTPSTGYRYTVNERSGWKNEKHQSTTSASAAHVFIVGFII